MLALHSELLAICSPRDKISFTVSIYACSLLSFSFTAKHFYVLFTVIVLATIKTYITFLCLGIFLGCN